MLNYRQQGQVLAVRLSLIAFVPWNHFEHSLNFDPVVVSYNFSWRTHLNSIA
jgi:hypothetical protein